MYDTPADILSAMRASAEVYTFLLTDVTHERASSAQGGDEGWSVVEVLGHLRDAEQISLARNRLMASQDNPTIQAFDQEALALERDYASARLEPTLNAFLDFRRQHLAFLESLSPDDWQRPGEHTEMGTISILNHQTHMVCHDSEHAAQIARQLAAV